MPTIYIIKNIYFIIFFNSIDKLLKYMNSNMNLNWNREKFNSKIELNYKGNPYIRLYDYEYDIMCIHIFEVETLENISFIEYSVKTTYDYDIILGTSSDFFHKVMSDVRKNYIKNKNTFIQIEDDLSLNYKKTYVKYSVNFIYYSYIFIYDIIYEYLVWREEI